MLLKWMDSDGEKKNMSFFLDYIDPGMQVYEWIYVQTTETTLLSLEMSFCITSLVYFDR